MSTWSEYKKPNGTCNRVNLLNNTTINVGLRSWQTQQTNTAPGSSTLKIRRHIHFNPSLTVMTTKPKLAKAHGVNVGLQSKYSCTEYPSCSTDWLIAHHKYSGKTENRIRRGILNYGVLISQAIHQRSKIKINDVPRMAQTRDH